MFDINFDPKKNLRFLHRIYTHAGKVVKEERILQYKTGDDPNDDWNWSNIPVADRHQEIKREDDLKYFGVD